MKNKYQISIILISAFFFQLGLSQIPETLSYQGALSDADGIMVEDGTYSITFQLGNTEGDPDWEEVHSLSVINGIFSVILGNQESFSFAGVSFTEPIFMDIIYDGSELDHIELTSSAYSMASKTSLTSSAVVGSANVFPSSGDVGIGNTDPGARLDVEGPEVDPTSDEYGRTVRFYNNLSSGSHRMLEIGSVGYESYVQAGDLAGHFYDLSLQARGGEVGIGTHDAEEKLHVARDVYDDSTDATTILIEHKDQRLRLGSYYDPGEDQYAIIQSEQDNGDPMDLILNSTGGDVGIGTTDPAGPLDVNGSIYVSGSEVIRDDGNSIIIGNVDTQSDSHARDVKIRTNGGDKLTILANGRVGIGTPSPSTNLTIQTEEHSLDGMIMRTGTDVGDGYISFYPSLGPGNWNPITQTGDAGIFYSHTEVNTGGLIIAPWSEVNRGLRMDNEGNVGIGTSPNAGNKLEVDGNAEINGNLEINAGINGGVFVKDVSTSSAAPFVKIQGKRSDSNYSQTFSGKLILEKHKTSGKINSANNIGTILFGGNHTDASEENIGYTASISGISEGDFNSENDSPTGIAFYTGSTALSEDVANDHFGTERMRIGANGNVGIGTNFPAGRLDVDGITTGLGIHFTGSNSRNDPMFTISGTGGHGGNPSVDQGLLIDINSFESSQSLLHIKENGNTIFKVNSNGYVTCVDLSCNSDVRYKKNIEPIVDALDKVKQLKGITYDWKDETKDPSRQMGFIAQDVEEIFPELVKTNGQGYKSMNYSKLVSVLVESVKELDEENQELDEENQSLESRIADLEKKMEILLSLNEKKPVDKFGYINN